MSMTPFLKDRLFRDIMRQSYLSLHIADPGLTGANEVAGGAYARQQTEFTPTENGDYANMEDLEFTRLPTARVNYAGLWDSPMGGNFLWGAWLGETQELRAGDAFVVDAGWVILRLT